MQPTVTVEAAPHIIPPPPFLISPLFAVDNICYSLAARNCTGSIAAMWVRGGAF